MMANSKHEDTEIGHQHWIKDTLEARNLAREYLRHCQHESVSNWQAVNVNDYVVGLHAAILDYHSHLSGKVESEREGGSVTSTDRFENWGSVLCTVPLPKPGTYDGGRTDIWGEYDINDLMNDCIEKYEKSVKCRTLNQEWGVQNEITVNLVLDGGEVMEQQKLTAYLPPAASRLVFHQLDLVLEKIGWQPPARPPDVGEAGYEYGDILEEGPGGDTPDHVEQNGE